MDQEETIEMEEMDPPAPRPGFVENWIKPTSTLTLRKQDEAFARVNADGTYWFDWGEIARRKDAYLADPLSGDISNAHAAMLWYARNSP